MKSNLGARARAASTASVISLAAAASLALGSHALASEPVQWDPAASMELANALHQLHHVWNSGDMEGVKRLLMGDDVLVSFELDPTTHKPIRLGSKQAIDAFVDGVVQVVDEEKFTTTFDHPKVNCRATPNFGICTEECTVHFTRPDGKNRTDKLWSTAAAVKVKGEWRWIQWQMAAGN